MSHRYWRRAAVGALVLALAVVGGTAAAAPRKAKKNATLEMKGKLTVKRNKFIRDGSRFSPGVVLIRSGGTLTLRNRQPQPHTFSIIKRSDVPRSTNRILNCGGPGTICETLFVSHQPNPEGEPTVPVVEVGAPGIDQAGDSIVINPKQTTKVNVSAKKGSELHFLCAIHAWMQGELRVR